MFVVTLCYMLLLLFYGFGLAAALRGLDLHEPKNRIVNRRRQRKMQGGINRG